MFFRKYQKAISFVLVFTIVFCFVMLPPKKVVAQGGLAGCVVSGIVSIIQAAVDGTSVPVKDWALNMKDTCIDGLFYVLNEIVIKQITADIINWVNTGFDGNPAFVEDFGKFQRDVAEQEVSDFLEYSGSGLQFLCSPFQSQIKIALLRANQRGPNGAFERSISCSFDEIGNNVENFLNGDFADGGWDAWTRLSYNNPYSDYLKVSLELEGRKLGALEQATEKVRWGKGFMSYEQCEEGEETVQTKTLTGTGVDGSGSLSTVDGETTFKKKECKIVTPGSVIETQLNTVLPAGFQRLQAADEINEIVDAVLAHYINKAITEGLSSLSKKDDSGKSYNDKTTESTLPSGEGIPPDDPTGGINNPNFNAGDFGLPDVPVTATSTIP